MGILSSARDVVTSKTTRRAIVKLTLLAGSSLALLFLAIIATAVFFASYIPDKSLTWPVYLQYGGASDNPFGVARVTPPLPKTEQQYDISVTVTLPESPRNTDRGNFMIALHLLDTDLSPAVDLVHPPESGRSLIDPQSVIFTARRPALMPYVDPAASLARRVALLPFHVLLPRKNAYSMTVPLAEGVIFPRSSKVPRSVYVELQAGQDLQTYDVSLTMTANLQGLRWILHNYSVLSFVTLTLGFWSMEMLFAGVALIVLGVLYGGQGPTAPELTVKEEDKEGEELGKVEVEERVAIQPTIKREHEHHEHGHGHGHEHGLELEPGRASDAEVERKEGRHGLRRRRIKHEEGESLGSDVRDEVDIKSEPESD